MSFQSHFIVEFSWFVWTKSCSAFLLVSAFLCLTFTGNFLFLVFSWWPTYDFFYAIFVRLKIYSIGTNSILHFLLTVTIYYILDFCVYFGVQYSLIQFLAFVSFCLASQRYSVSMVLHAWRNYDVWQGLIVFLIFFLAFYSSPYFEPVLL